VSFLKELPLWMSTENVVVLGRTLVWLIPLDSNFSRSYRDGSRQFVPGLLWLSRWQLKAAGTKEK
jgi:hypothetical protein